MKLHDFWQNFELGIEIDIAGTFIYDGLNNLHHMENFAYETEIFNVLYNLSVGVERFFKVAIILIEFNIDTKQDEFEKGLITHNHADLLARIIKNRQVNLSSVHNDFISLLSKFYKSFRYDRYGLQTVSKLSKEKKAFISFLSKYNVLETAHHYDDQDIYPNTNKVRRFIGKVVSKIILQIYGIIRAAAREKNLYTYEVRYDSKVGVLLLREKFHFMDEDVMWKELLIFILNTKNESKYLNYIKNINPLDLDIALLGDYLQVFNNKVKNIAVLDEIECLYSDGEFSAKDRLNSLEVIGDPQASFYFYEDEDEDEDEDEGN